MSITSTYFLNLRSHERSNNMRCKLLHTKVAAIRHHSEVWKINNKVKVPSTETISDGSNTL